MRLKSLRSLAHNTEAELKVFASGGESQHWLGKISLSKACPVGFFHWHEPQRQSPL